MIIRILELFKKHTMATLTIDEKRAKEIYPSAASELKALLENTFGKSFFSQKITDRIKTFEDVLEAFGILPSAFKAVTAYDLPDEIAYKQLKLIVKVLNEGWEPNWDNSNEYKYYPWMCMDSPSGFGLICVSYSSSTSGVGSRLCFKSEALAKYAAEQFKSVYEQFFINK
jgi:hypothetical protein